MFERFTGEARDVVAAAQDEARRLRQPYIGTEHLLLAMLGGRGDGTDLLTARGMSAEAVRQRLRGPAGAELDAAALSTLGIDLDQVRRAAEQQFGPGALARDAKPMPTGHLSFTKRAKKVLELAVREAQGLGSDSINSAHLLLGLIDEAEGLAGRLIREARIDPYELAAEARARARRAA